VTEDVLSLQIALECRFGLIIREFQLIVSRLFIMDIASITAFQTFDLVHEHETATPRYVKDFAAYPHLFGIERIFVTEFHLV
jgi:hypothetical protein